MRPSTFLFNAAKQSTRKTSRKDLIPVEVYPLFGAMGFVLIYAGYSLGSKFKGQELRKTRQGNIAHPSSEGDSHH